MFGIGRFRIGIIGLGYVGTPLFEGLSKHFNVVGFDVDPEKTKIKNVTDDMRGMVDCDVLIVCVPTPLNDRGLPDMSYIQSAFSNINTYAKTTTHVVVESTISYEDLNHIVLFSGIQNLGYSPERISPGETTIKDNPKLISANNRDTLDIMDKIYSKICEVHRIDDIENGVEIAVKAKLLENTQRAVNIALMNDLYNSNPNLYKEIIDAASTKNNFIKFSPGLVGGQCIPVDYNFLGLKSTNNYIKSTTQKISDCVRIRLREISEHKNGKIICFGVGYKKNSGDIKYSENYKFVELLRSYLNNVFVYDPLCGIVEVESFNDNDILIRLVDHDIFKPLDLKYDIIVN